MCIHTRTYFWCQISTNQFMGNHIQFIAPHYVIIHQLSAIYSSHWAWLMARRICHYQTIIESICIRTTELMPSTLMPVSLNMRLSQGLVPPRHSRVYGQLVQQVHEPGDGYQLQHDLFSIASLSSIGYDMGLVPAIPAALWCLIMAHGTHHGITANAWSWQTICS